MSLSTEQQQTGAIVVVKCAGRIVEGGESSALQHEIDRLLDETPFGVLNLAAVDFIDSSGLGLLVRLLNRARLAGGDLRICAPSRRLVEILRVTRLEKILPPHESASAAIAATYDHARSTQTLNRLATGVLCVAESRDVLVYVCEMLRQAGFGVMSSDNLPDALMLLRAVRPKAVVIDAELRAAGGTCAAESFTTLAETRAVIELPPDFSQSEAGESSFHLYVVSAFRRTSRSPAKAGHYVLHGNENGSRLAFGCSSACARSFRKAKTQTPEKSLTRRTRHWLARSGERAHQRMRVEGKRGREAPAPFFEMAPRRRVIYAAA